MGTGTGVDSGASVRVGDSVSKANPSSGQANYELSRTEAGGGGGDRGNGGYGIECRTCGAKVPRYQPGIVDAMGGNNGAERRGMEG